VTLEFLTRQPSREEAAAIKAALRTLSQRKNQQAARSAWRHAARMPEATIEDLRAAKRGARDVS